MSEGARGDLALVLHTHMPYVEGFGTWPFGEEWLWEAMATSYLPLLDVLDDAPERSGSENRHDDVRESGSQDSHSQVAASELGRPWSPRVEGVWEERRRGSDLLRRCSGASWRTRSRAAPIAP